VLRTIRLEERTGIVLCAGAARDAHPLLRMTTRAPSIHAIGIAQLVAWGATFYAIPPLLPQIGADLSLSMSSLSGAMTIGLILNAFASIAVARWIHRRGARVPMMTGTIAAGCALVLLATSTGAIAFLALALLCGTQAALLYEPAFAAVSAQSVDAGARTRAIQVITFWGGWAGFWALPAATFLGEWLGWHPTLLVFSALLVGHTLRVHARLPPPALARSHAAAARTTRISIGLAAAYATGAFVTTAMIVNGIPMLDARGTALETGSLVFALLAPIQVVGRVWFMRRRGHLARHDGSLPFVLVSGGVLALVAAPHSIAFALFVLLFGSGVGLLTTIRAAIVVSRVPVAEVARHLGVYSFVTALARAVAPAASSWIYFAIGYELALIVFASMALFAAGLVWRAAR
jgi:MFS family permease